MSSHNGKVSRKTDSEVVKTIGVIEKNAPTDLILNENDMNALDDKPPVKEEEDSRKSIGSELKSESLPLESDHVRPIDERFQTRFSTLTRLRSSSNSIPSFNGLNDYSNLKDTVRWVKLRKISSQIFSEAASNLYGKPTCLLTATIIAVGTSKGIILVFDYYQTLKSIIGPKTKAMRCGEVTSLAISDDFSYIAAGHTNGHIFTWELTKPSTYNIHVHPIRSDMLRRSDGHILGTKVVHLSFVSKRHSALISGDVNGLAFVHDTVRTLIGRTVLTQRIMGRYPQNQLNPEIKPTTLLACAPLPHSSMDKVNDEICLVAIMTPNLLALVSVLPTPQTQFKTGRPKSVSNTMGLSGCLTWFLTYKSSTPRLAYCWSNVLTVMEVSVTKQRDNSIAVNLTIPKRYVGEEAIVSVQWISDKIIALVTVTQYLLLLNYDTMTVVTSLDLANKHILHHDYFSRALETLTLVDPKSQQLLPVLATDAYFNSIDSFKGKLFLMGNYEFVVGSISNWADRLLDTMEIGDYKGAIELATSYYLGVQDSLVVGLPDDDEERKSLVMKNLPEMIIASIRYTFNESRRTDESDKQQWMDQLRSLSKTCFDAWIVIGKPDNLFEEMFELYEHAGVSLVFLEELAEYISHGKVTYIPPTIFHELVKQYVAIPECQEKLEELICTLDVTSMDLDFIISLCNKNHLKDTLIYVWSYALGDFLTPFIDFIDIVTTNKKETLAEEATKIYPYICYILTGRIYPTGVSFENLENSLKAKCYIYYFIFSSSNIAWPKGGPIINTQSGGTKNEPKYPYLLLLIQFNCSAFFSALHEVFEDSFLNETDTNSLSSHTNKVAFFGYSINRQRIIDILLDLFDSASEKLVTKRIFLSIFIARNYPKYSQFIDVSDVILSSVLEEVCQCRDPELKEDCELAIEALLSKYKPTDFDQLIAALFEAKYYHVLAYIYKSDKEYTDLLKVSLLQDVTDKTQLLDIMVDGFKHAQGNEDNGEINDIVSKNFEQLMLIDCPRFVRILSKYAPTLHENILDVDTKFQSEYMKALVETKSKSKLPEKLQALSETLSSTHM